MHDLVATRDATRFAGPPTRFVTAATRSTVIERSRLDARFQNAAGRVIRVLAPGGYGKSTLIARWVVDDRRTVRWIDLEPIDNDPLVLAHTLTQGLADLGSSGPDATSGRGLADLVAGCTEPFVLVLDDIHCIDGAASAALFDLVIENLPPESTLVLAGRAHYGSGAIARFRLEPGVTDVGADDLAFDLAETEQLLKAMGVELDIDALSDVADKFEGWPAGLRLAGIVLTNRDGEPRVRIADLDEIEYVNQYIAEEWFGGFDRADQRFLMEIGCLGRFSGDKCDETLGIDDSAAILRRLCRDEVVLSALDERGEWYRLHPLLRRWLSSRLRSQDRARWREIHMAATRWWERDGDIDLAIEHAMAVDDVDRCEELIAAHAGTHLARGMHPTVQRWLANLDDHRIRSSPRLRIVAAIIALGACDGDAALNWARLGWGEMNRLEDDVDRSGDATYLQTEALHAALEPGSAVDLIPHAEHAHRLLPVGPWRAFTGLVLGAYQYIAGDEQAMATLRDTLFENELGRLTTLNANAAAVLAIVLDLEGERQEAAELAARAVELLASRSGETFPATGPTMAIASLIDARAGRHEAASQHLAISRERLDEFERCAPWYRILGLVTLIRTHLLLDEAHLARDLVRQLERAMETQDGSTPFAEQVRRVGDSVRTAIALRAERSWALTAAELRVVLYLPTNLSLADIAERLYVSRNTVKSHAAAIYRKLGTSSRSEAVERARRAGLIDESSSVV